MQLPVGKLIIYIGLGVLTTMLSSVVCSTEYVPKQESRLIHFQSAHWHYTVSEYRWLGKQILCPYASYPDSPLYGPKGGCIAAIGKPVLSGWSRLLQPSQTPGISVSGFEVAVGWPFRSFVARCTLDGAVTGGVRLYDRELVLTGVSCRGNPEVGLLEHGAGVLPLTPYLPGLLLSLLIHVVGFAFVIEISRFIVRLGLRGLRSVRGNCPNCGYQRDRLLICPECGHLR